MRKIIVLIILLGSIIFPYNIVLADNGMQNELEAEFPNLGKSSIFYDELDFVWANPYIIYYTNIGMSKDDFITKFEGTRFWENLEGNYFSRNDFIRIKNGENVYLIRKVKNGLVLFTGVFEDNKLVMSLVQMYSNNLKDDLAPLYKKTALMYAYQTKATEKTLKDYKVGNKDVGMMINTETQNISITVNSGMFPTLNAYRGQKYKFGFFITHVDKKYKI